MGHYNNEFVSINYNKKDLTPTSEKTPRSSVELVELSRPTSRSNPKSGTGLAVVRGAGLLRLDARATSSSSLVSSLASSGDRANHHRRVRPETSQQGCLSSHSHC